MRQGEQKQNEQQFNISGLFSFDKFVPLATLSCIKKHNLKHINQTSTHFNIAHSISLKKNYTPFFKTLLLKINNYSRCIQYYTQNMKDKLFDNFLLPVSPHSHSSTFAITSSYKERRGK